MAEKTEHSFSVRDFLAFGNQYGIDYRFGRTGSQGLVADSDTVAAGRVSETTLPSGFRLTHSELEVFRDYESASLGHARLLVVLVLQGEVAISIGSLHRTLKAGTAVSLQLHPDYSLRVLQPAQQGLETLTLALDPGKPSLQGQGLSTLADLLGRVYQPVHVWPIPASLAQNASATLASPLSGRRRELLLEGLALQLSAHGLPADAGDGAIGRPVSPGQQQRLELVRQLIEFSPADDYTLAGLAERAAMSPSGLRAKFRDTYGITVFEHLRRCRLELARRYLVEGYSVQQAAHCSGYRHASNFSTAFRRHFGVAPKKRPCDDR